ncbi:hypothetical protein DFO70_1343 [Cytobacillus firmus]|uniref:Cytosolic protein n=2 Tax=Cytobacillus TaxID=2675230 RepID=A0A366JIA9_CYTFI|nr:MULTISPECIES: DUF6282 family protein [Cytobacillus]RBP86055.1 hypothetical protein DFO70_1343 [Cytobacillus firmus]TDX35398.1 hypothetical protein DFO72_1303 [Cytobacillus oceanisediminis]
MAQKFHPLLKGAIELHVHSSPSLFPRKQTDWELIEDIKSAEMAGVVLKAHEAQTVDRASLIREKEPGFHVYGGLVCNYFTGGLSPTAVDAAIRLGAKIIWMPTFSAEEHQRYFGKKKTNFFNSKRSMKHPGSGIEIWDENKNLLSEVYEILELVAEADIVLATGHLAAEEVLVLVEAAIEKNVEKILIQHTDLGIARVPFELEKELVKKGCILEKCYLACSEDFNDISPREMAESIKVLGADSCVMVTDYGQRHNIAPIKALSNFIEEMLAYGITEDEITKMVSDNPKRLLGI